MKRPVFLIAAALLFAGAASATCKGGATCNPTPAPAPTPAPSSSTSSASTSSSSSQSSSAATSNAGASSFASVGVNASPSSNSSAIGGSVGPMSQSFEEFSKSNLYVLPAPAAAAPLPPGLCPKGDSMSIGILWNLFSYSTSSTRSELECLDRVLAAWRQAPRVEIVQAPPIPAPAAPAPAPVAATAAPTAAPAAAPPPSAFAATASAPKAKKVAAVKKPASAPAKSKLELDACPAVANQCKITTK